MQGEEKNDATRVWIRKAGRMSHLKHNGGVGGGGGGRRSSGAWCMVECVMTVPGAWWNA